MDTRPTERENHIRHVHTLKVWPQYFKPVVEGLKRFEIRKNDRDYSVGDILVLMEYIENACKYTGNTIALVVTYIFNGGRFGLDEDYIIMGIHPNIGYLIDGAEEHLE